MKKRKYTIFENKKGKNEKLRKREKIKQNKTKSPKKRRDAEKVPAEQPHLDGSIQATKSRRGLSDLTS